MERSHEVHAASSANPSGRPAATLSLNHSLSPSNSAVNSDTLVAAEIFGQPAYPEAGIRGDL